jgi:hypothetical protein
MIAFSVASPDRSATIRPVGAPRERTTPDSEAIEVEIDHWCREQRQKLAENEPTHHDDFGQRQA